MKFWDLFLNDQRRRNGVRFSNPIMSVSVSEKTSEKNKGKSRKPQAIQIEEKQKVELSKRIFFEFIIYSQIKFDKDMMYQKSL